MAVSYGNKFLAASGAGTEFDPAIVQVALRVRRQATYGEVSGSFPLPIYRSPLVVFPFAGGLGNREILSPPPSGQRYILNSLFLSSSSGTGVVSLEQDDGDTYQEFGAFPVSPRVMGNTIQLQTKLLPNAAVLAYPDSSNIAYGGFFLGRIV